MTDAEKTLLDYIVNAYARGTIHQSLESMARNLWQERQDPDAVKELEEALLDRERASLRVAAARKALGFK